MSSWNERERLSAALVSASRDENGKQRMVGIQVSDGVTKGHFVAIGPGGFVEVKSENEGTGFVNPDAIVSWCFLDGETDD